MTTASVVKTNYGKAARICQAPGCELLCALLAVCCASGGLLPPSSNRLALGTWGGENAGVIVTDSVAHVHGGCSFGDIPGRVQLGADGRFTADGSYVLRAYPVAVEPSLPAQFSGQVTVRQLTLAIAVNDTVEHKVVALDPVVVLYGRTPNLGPCPICQSPRLRR